MAIPSYPELQEKYGGQFVALRDGEVVTAGRTYGELLAAVQRAGLDRFTLTFEHIEPIDALRACRVLSRRVSPVAARPGQSPI